MKRNTIRYIIGLATVLLITLVVTQVSWVRKAYELEQKQFSYDVTQALLTALGNLQKAAGDSSIILNPIVQEKPNLFVVKVHFISDPYLIESHLKMEFQQAAIHESFIFNIYDCFSDSVVYCKKFKKNHIKVNKPIPVLNWSRDEGHYFSVYFPERTSGLFYQMEFWIYSSIILIVIIAFFGFIISQLLKQRRVNEMKTDFINNMTHEFKTPLSTISIAVEALNQPNIIEKPERLSRYTKIIQSENSRLQAQVERILVAATIKKENVLIQKQPIDTHSLITQVSNVFKINVESKQGDLNTYLSAENAIIQGDEEHFKNILSNLIDNAIKYSLDNLDVTISTKNEGGKLIIEITDKGIGIPKEFQSQIFEKFYRVPTGNLHNVKGFGIGLNYVEVLVKKHNGTIQLSSKPEKGTTFTLTFKTI